MSKKLTMTFLTSGNRRVSMSVTNPKDNLTGAEVSSAMDKIIANNIFEYSSGTLIEKVSAIMHGAEEMEIS